MRPGPFLIRYDSLEREDCQMRFVEATSTAWDYRLEGIKVDHFPGDRYTEDVSIDKFSTCEGNELGLFAFWYHSQGRFLLCVALRRNRQASFALR